MSRLKKELMLACEERDNHQLDKELLTNRLRHLEEELEASKNSVNEKTRESRLLEVKRMQGDQGEVSRTSGCLLAVGECLHCYWCTQFSHPVVKQIRLIS